MQNNPLTPSQVAILEKASNNDNHMVGEAEQNYKIEATGDMRALDGLGFIRVADDGATAAVTIAGRLALKFIQQQGEKNG